MRKEPEKRYAAPAFCRGAAAEPAADDDKKAVAAAAGMYDLVCMRMAELRCCAELCLQFARQRVPER